MSGRGRATSMQMSESLLCTAIVQQASEAVIFADRAGHIRLWNRGAEAIFGFSAEEAIGVSLDIIVPERFRSAHWSGFHEAIESGRTRHGGEVRTTRGLHKDGRKLYVELSFGLITTPAGEVAGSLAIGRPGNERFAKDAGMQARIAALQSELAGLRRPTGS
jgi:PAS domain S-box-containing protein